MKKNNLLLISLLLSASSLFAQTTHDSIAIVNAQWKAKKITKGLYWKSTWVENLYQSNQNINILEIQPKAKKLELLIGYQSDSLFNTSRFAKMNQAIAAINGTFFNIKKGGSVDYLKVNGKVINQTLNNDKGRRPIRVNGALAFTDKNVVISKIESTQIEDSLKYENVISSGPMLLVDRQIEKLDSSAFSKNRHPRTCVCETTDRKILLVTVDGRNAKAQGMNLYELAYMLKTLGCKNALNFDGGGSTTMWIKGQSDNGVVNKPSDNKKFDNYGERSVANVIMVRIK